MVRSDGRDGSREISSGQHADGDLRHY